MQYRPMRQAFALAATAALFGTLAACDDATLSPDVGGRPFVYAGSGEPPKVVEGRLVFADTAHLDAYLKPLAVATPADLARQESTLPGFQSLRAHLDNGLWQEEAAKATEGSEEPTGNEAAALEKDGVTRSDFAVSDGFLSALNARGEVQVGGDVYKVTRDNVFRTRPEQVRELSAAVPTLSSPAPQDGRFEFVPVETTTRPTDEAPAFSRAATGEVGGVDTQALGSCVVYGGGGRHYGSSYISHYWFYAEAGVLTEWQRRHGWWIFSWWASAWQPGVLSHSWNSSFGPGGAAQASTHRIHNLLQRRVGWFPRINGWINAQHNSPAGTCWT